VEKSLRRPDAVPFHDTGLLLQQTIHIPGRGLTVWYKKEGFCACGAKIGDL
jgi:hypothetical protein